MIDCGMRRRARAAGAVLTMGLGVTAALSANVVAAPRNGEATTQAAVPTHAAAARHILFSWRGALYSLTPGTWKTTRLTATPNYSGSTPYLQNAVWAPSRQAIAATTQLGTGHCTLRS
jgi:hypothetical protein